MLASAFLSMWMSNTTNDDVTYCFSVTSFGRNTWGAKVKEVYDYIAWGGIWMLYWRNCYISGTSNLSFVRILK
jgi:di/tricarboxylate transporter